MTLCIKTGYQCNCQPDDGVFCPDYKPDWYVQCLMDAITSLRSESRVKAANAAASAHRDLTADEIEWMLTHPAEEWPVGSDVALARMAARSLPSKSRGTASAWLIEMHAGATLWFAGTFRKEGRKELADFVTDANEAVRYPTKEAAERALNDLDDRHPRCILGRSCYRVTEHEWIESAIREKP